MSRERASDIDNGPLEKRKDLQLTKWAFSRKSTIFVILTIADGSLGTIIIGGCKRDDPPAAPDDDDEAPLPTAPGR